MSGGFTLLELLVVLFLVLLVLGMGFVGFAGRLPAARLEATAREMAAAMRQARTLAKVQMAKQALVVDLDGRVFAVEGKPPRRIPEEVRVRIDDPAGASPDKGIHRLVFSPFGGIDGGTIAMTAGRRRLCIKPDPVVGFSIDRTP